MVAFLLLFVLTGPQMDADMKTRQPKICESPRFRSQSPQRAGHGFLFFFPLRHRLTDAYKHFASDIKPILKSVSTEKTQAECRASTGLSFCFQIDIKFYSEEVKL